MTTERPDFLPLVRGRRTYPLLLGLTLLVYVQSVPWRVGLPTTASGDPSIWALHIVHFLFFTGVSAGAIVVGAVVGALGTEGLRPIARIAEVGAISALVAAAVFLAIDLVRLGRVWQPGRDPHVALVPGDVAIIGIYLGSAVALGYLASRARLVRSAARASSSWPDYLAALGRAVLPDNGGAHARRVLTELAAILIPAAILLHSIPALILALVKARPGGQAIVIAAPFYVSSVVSGLAFVIAAVTVSRALGRLQIEKTIIQSLGRALLLLTPALGYCLFAEILTVVAAREPAGGHVFHEMVLGSYAGLFWFDLIGGVIAPSLLLAFSRTLTAGRVTLAAVLVVVAVLLQRWNIVVPTLLGHAHFSDLLGVRAPSSAEVSLTLGAYAVGLLVYVALARRFLRREHSG